MLKYPFNNVIIHPIWCKLLTEKPVKPKGTVWVWKETDLRLALSPWHFLRGHMRSGSIVVLWTHLMHIRCRVIREEGRDHTGMDGTSLPWGTNPSHLSSSVTLVCFFTKKVFQHGLWVFSVFVLLDLRWEEACSWNLNCLSFHILDLSLQTSTP